MHVHRKEPLPRTDSLKAAGLNLAAGAAELIVGRSESSLALFADMTHNLGDALGYSLNGITADKSEAVHLRWRKRAAGFVCAGALAVGAWSAHEYLSDEATRPEAVAPIVAVGAGAISYNVHRRMERHEHLGAGHGDNALHARWDMYCAPVTIATTAIASMGIEKIDSIGGMLVSAVTVYVNRPSQIE